MLEKVKLKTIISLVLLLIFALSARLIWLDHIPISLNPDEADNLRTYLEFTATKKIDYLAVNWNGAPIVNIIFLGKIWQAFGNTFWGAKMAAILVSTLAIMMSYLLMRKAKITHFIAWLLAMLLATDAVFLHFSRSAWENIYVSIPVLCLLATRWVNWRFKIIYYSLAIVLGLYGYHTGKIVAIVATLSLIIELFSLLILKRKAYSKRRVYQQIFEKNNLQWLVGQFFLLMLVAILGILQLKSFFYDHKIAATSRINNVSVMSESDPSKLVFENTKATFKAFLTYQQKLFTNGLYSRYLPEHQWVVPMLVVIGYWLGLLVAVKSYKRLIVWLVLMLFPIQILSKGTPDVSRSFHLFPMIYFLAALGYNAVWLHLKRKFNNLGLILKFILIVGAITTAHQQLNRYFSWIVKKSTITAREPSILQSEYPTWLSTQQKLAKNKGFTYNTGEWKAIYRSNN